MKIPLTYYGSNDVESIARSLLGKYLFSNINNTVTGGIITETEAYKGIEDKASHSYGGKRTARTETMYMTGGISYVYLCYGIHNLLNVVTAEYNTPHAVLFRAIFPTIGIHEILKRANKDKLNYSISNGPGKLTKALGITKEHNGISFSSDILWIEDRKVIIDEKDIITGPRVGVDYAKEDALLPYRYVLNYKKYIKKTP